MRRLIITLFIFLGSLSAQEFYFDEFIVNRALSERAEDTGEFALLNYDVYNSNGSKLYSVKIRSGFDIPFPNPIIQDNGVLVLVNSFEGQLDYYDNAGNYLRQVKLFKEPSPNYERAVFSDLSSELSVHLLTESVENALLLVLFDYSGTELNRFELEAGQGAGVVIDDNSEMIAVSQYTWKGNDLVTESRVYDLGGKVNNSFPRLFKYAEFIDGGRYLCGYTNKGLFLGSLETNEIVLDVEAPTTSVILDVVNDGDYFWVVSSPNPRLKSGIWIYKNFSYAKYDLDGKLLSNKDQSTKQFSSARFVSSGSGVTLMIDSTEYPIE